MSQVRLFQNTWTKDKFAFGGSLLKGSHPKGKRPFSPKLPLHVVMRSENARGAHSLLLHGITVTQILNGQADRHHVKILSAANAGNHIHLLLQAPSRAHLSAFLRSIAGRIAQAVMNAKSHRMIVKPRKPETTRSPASAASQGFWDARPFSRIVSWGRDALNVARYLALNSTEMTGISRSGVRAIFAEVQMLLQRGQIPRTPGLIAAGFI